MCLFVCFFDFLPFTFLTRLHTNSVICVDPTRRNLGIYFVSNINYWFFFTYKITVLLYKKWWLCSYYIIFPYQKLEITYRGGLRNFKLKSWSFILGWRQVTKGFKEYDYDAMTLTFTDLSPTEHQTALWTVVSDCALHHYHHQMTGSFIEKWRSFPRSQRSSDNLVTMEAIWLQ